ncbi:hypothetical protein HAZT_HAZT008198 [Hyalella azteca]|uniref:Uncharacterized protein n=1 Tax=Hyalella azteca TaxID=294128 RepID=A0A6A0HFS3_HYAAZ|nr:hypothetical protein HAZT_HAZT008198 [Hyalella azteca]
MLIAEKWCVAGLAASLRFVLKQAVEKNNDVLAKKLLGFRLGCLQSCSEIPWSDYPKAVHPQEGNLPLSRLQRKCQQLENMIHAVLRIAKPGHKIVDFCAADQTHGADHPSTAQGQLCMRLVDGDRLLHAQQLGYSTELHLMVPPSCSPKNHILIGTRT